MNFIVPGCKMWTAIVNTALKRERDIKGDELYKDGRIMRRSMIGIGGRTRGQKSEKWWIGEVVEVGIGPWTWAPGGFSQIRQEAILRRGQQARTTGVKRGTQGSTPGVDAPFQDMENLWILTGSMDESDPSSVIIVENRDTFLAVVPSLKDGKLWRLCLKEWLWSRRRK